MNFNTNYNSPQFTAITIKPHPSKWNKEVLESVLSSTAIKDKIIAGEKSGSDSVLEYTHNILENSPPNMLFTNMNVKFSNNVSRLTFKAENGSAMVPMDGTYIFLKKGPEDLGKDIAKQIDSLSETTTKKSIEEGLKDLRKISSDVIYEPIPQEKPQSVHKEPVKQKGFFARMFEW